MTIPGNPLEFYLHPIVLLALSIGLVIVLLGILAINVPKVREYLKPLFKIYYVVTLAPIYAVVGLLYIITIGRLNLFRKLKEVNFTEKYKNLYQEPTKTFEDMRLNPHKYHLWVAILIYVPLSFLAQFFIVMVSQKFYNGQESIIFGILSPASTPSIIDPIQRWLVFACTGPLIWIPTKFTINFLAVKFHKYDNSDEPQGRPWYDKVRLLYISWSYIITADVIWSIGLAISLSFAIWEGMIFAWVAAVICGIIEMFLQFYNIRGLYKMGWKKAIFFWLVSMIPAFLMMVVLQWWLGPLVVGLFN